MELGKDHGGEDGIVWPHRHSMETTRVYIVSVSHSGTKKPAFRATVRAVQEPEAHAFQSLKEVVDYFEDDALPAAAQCNGVAKKDRSTDPRSDGSAS